MAVLKAAFEAAVQTVIGSDDRRERRRAIAFIVFYLKAQGNKQGTM